MNTSLLNEKLLSSIAQSIDRLEKRKLDDTLNYEKRREFKCISFSSADSTYIYPFQRRTNIYRINFSKFICDNNFYNVNSYNNTLKVGTVQFLPPNITITIPVGNYSVNRLMDTISDLLQPHNIEIISKTLTEDNKIRLESDGTNFYFDYTSSCNELIGGYLSQLESQASFNTFFQSKFPVNMINPRSIRVLIPELPFSYNTVGSDIIIPIEGGFGYQIVEKNFPNKAISCDGVGFNQLTFILCDEKRRQLTLNNGTWSMEIYIESDDIY